MCPILRLFFFLIYRMRFVNLIWVESMLLVCDAIVLQVLKLLPFESIYACCCMWYEILLYLKLVIMWCDLRICLHILFYLLYIKLSFLSSIWSFLSTKKNRGLSIFLVSQPKKTVNHKMDPSTKFMVWIFLLNYEMHVSLYLFLFLLKVLIEALYQDGFES